MVFFSIYLFIYSNHPHDILYFIYLLCQLFDKNILKIGKVQVQVKLNLIQKKSLSHIHYNTH